MASFEAAAAAVGTTAFLTSEVLIGPFEILEVSDCDLVGVVAGLLELEVIVLAGAFDAAAFAKLIGLIFVFEPLFTGLFVLLVSSTAGFSLVVLVLTLVSSTGVTSTSLMASLIVSVLDFYSS
jgi:hypothetical protein